MQLNFKRRAVPFATLRSYDWLGFDLDHCIARYKLHELYPLIFESLRSFLLEEAGYAPDTALARLSWHDVSGLVAKGIVLDLETGDSLKLDSDGRVVQARHGRRMLGEPELDAAYGTTRRWTHFDDLRAGVRSKSFNAFATHFDVPAIPLAMVMVEMADAAEGTHGRETSAGAPEPRYAHIFRDLLAGFDWNFSTEAFAPRRGRYFAALQDDVGRYVYARPNVRRWIVAQRAAGQRVLLGTNSHIEYTRLLLDHCFGSDWRGEIADVLVVNCGKPGWFDRDGADGAFFRLDVAGTREGAQVPPGYAGGEGFCMKPRTGEVFARGSLAALREHDWFGPCATMLYFGDSYSSDVLAAQRAGLDAVLVLEELADDAALEGENAPAMQRELRQLGFGVTLGAPAEDCCNRHYLRKSQWGSFFLAQPEGGTAQLHYWAALAQEAGNSVISSINDILHIQAK